MTAAYIHRYVLPAAYANLPAAMESPAASAMLLAIAMQESKCCHRRQIMGPARGFWQFELGGVRGVMTHRASKAHLADALEGLAYPVTDDATGPYVSIEHNDALAAVCARLLLWTLPTGLPRIDQADAGWAQYLSAWRPGKPHPETWAANFASAWARVNAETGRA